jgi:hypothetical protein
MMRATRLTIPIPQSKYNENGYKPDFNELPLEADYWAAHEKQRAADAQKHLWAPRTMMILLLEISPLWHDARFHC